MTDPAGVVVGEDGLARCAWCSGDAEYRRYHDEEWGVPLVDDTRMLEKICLEGFQSGLSWLTILKRRDAFREVFHGFDAQRVAAMDDGEVERAMADARIIRNRAKILATIGNAQATLTLDDERLVALTAAAPRGLEPPAPVETAGALTRLIWAFAPRPAARPRSPQDVPTSTPESAALSAALRSAGFRFVGATTVYALAQSAGLVDDHLDGCWRAA